LEIALDADVPPALCCRCRIRAHANVGADHWAYLGSRLEQFLFATGTFPGILEHLSIVFGSRKRPFDPLHALRASSVAHRRDGRAQVVRSQKRCWELIFSYQIVAIRNESGWSYQKKCSARAKRPKQLHNHQLGLL
jgi:hypothetical protein